MHTQKLIIVASLAAVLVSNPGTAAPPKGGSSTGGSGGFHGSTSSSVSAAPKSAPMHVGSTGASGSGSSTALNTFKTHTSVGSGISSGGSSNLQSQNLLQQKNVTTFNQNLSNHTPTFTNPGHVTTSTNKLSVSSPTLNKVTSPTLNKVTSPALNKVTSPALNKVPLNPHVTNFNSQVTKSFGGTQFQTFHKTPGGPFQAHAISGNQLLLHTNTGKYQTINAHVYNQTFIGNQTIIMSPVGYHPSYLMHASWYNSPWSGSAWGWGWGLGPGFGFGLGGLGWGIGLGGGWGYGGLGYGPFGPFGPYGYWGRPLGWGFGGWGLGGLAYSCGYYPYYNPYYVPTTTIVYNYSNPIPVATSPVAYDGAAVAEATAPIPQSENPEIDAARAAFRDGNYDAALAHVDAAIAQTPTDAVFHEFRALVLFAMQDYKQAAGVIHSVLAMGPGWDWTTMSGLYADPEIYTQQLRALEQFVLGNPRAADAHFLLAYHYTTAGHSAAAANQLQQVVTLMPSDRLAGELLKMIQGPPKQDPATPPDAGVTADEQVQPAPDGSEPPAIDKDLLPGNWRASRPDGSKFELRLTDDGKFSWKFSPPKQKGDEFSGTWSTEGPVLILQRDGGGALPGTVTFNGNGKFNFRMVGAPPEDKGLDFST
jgi:hypothetical protein